MRWLGALLLAREVEAAGTAAPFVMVVVGTGTGGGGAVATAVTGGGAVGGREGVTVMLPAERRRRSMLEKPKPPVLLEGVLEGSVGNGWTNAETDAPVLLGLGDGGCGGEGLSCRWSWAEEFPLKCD